MNIELMLQIALALISIIGALITYVLVPYLRTQTTEAKRKKMWNWVLVAVQAAEQLYKSPGAGQDKKAYVLDKLNQKGIKIDAAQLDLLIEAAVYQLNQAKNAFILEGEPITREFEFEK